MTRNHRYLLFALSLLAILVTGGWLTPRLAGLLYGSQAGRLLKEAIERVALPTDPPDRVQLDPIPCSIPPLTSPADLERVEQAILDLQRAIKLNPSSSHNYLLLGRAYCLGGKPEKAVKNLLTYARMRPGNPLGEIELGFAYEAVCLQHLGLSMQEYPNRVCEESKTLASMRQAWEQAGLQPEEFLAAARNAFDTGRWDEVEYNYRFGLRSGGFGETELEPADRVRWAMGAAITGFPLPEAVRSGLPVAVLDGKARLEAEDLLWLSKSPHESLAFSEPIGKLGPKQPDETGARLGVLYWNGRAGQWVEVTEAGRYRFTLRVKNLPPAPTRVRLEHNLDLLGELALNREDASYQDFTFEADLIAGLHLVSINFLNNARVGDLDRNAALDYVEIERIKDK